MHDCGSRSKRSAKDTAPEARVPGPVRARPVTLASILRQPREVTVETVREGLPVDSLALRADVPDDGRRGSTEMGRRDATVKKASRIYCIEGHWGYGDREVEPSVEPILQLMANMDLWPYVRRDCATKPELEFFLREEWCRRCEEQSVLYLATHGWDGGITLSEGQDVPLEELAVYLEPDGAEGCIVHFSGCEVMKARESQLRDFIANTKAAAISGYTKEGGWTSALEPGGRGVPSLALELLLFSTIETLDINLSDGRSFGRLRALADDLDERFPDCGFRLLTRPAK